MQNQASLAIRASKTLTHGEKSFFERTWPDLAVISCWTDGASAAEARRLREFFPTTAIQGKGLLATEACVSLPLAAGRGPVLAVRSHFFEFTTDDGRCLAAHEVEAGTEYSVVVTTGGGLYRYRLEDRVLVTGFLGTTPTLRFLGKAGHVCDRYGEKLHVRHVRPRSWMPSWPAPAGGSACSRPTAARQGRVTRFIWNPAVRFPPISPGGWSTPCGKIRTTVSAPNWGSCSPFASFACGETGSAVT